MSYLASIHEIINFAGLALDVVGVLIIVIGAVLSTLAFLTPWRAHPLTYRGYRKNVAPHAATRRDTAGHSPVGNPYNPLHFLQIVTTLDGRARHGQTAANAPFVRPPWESRSWESRSPREPSWR